MAEDNDAMDEEEIETTLAFDVDRHPHYDPLETVAEAVIERGDRRIDYLYEIDTSAEDTELHVMSRYYLDGELKNEDHHGNQSYPIDGERVYHTEKGQDLQEFIESNAFGDLEVSLTDEFESMVDEV